MSESVPDDLGFLLAGRGPGKRRVKPVSYEKAQANLKWVREICGDDEEDDDDAELVMDNENGNGHQELALEDKLVEELMEIDGAGKVNQTVHSDDLDDEEEMDDEEEEEEEDDDDDDAESTEDSDSSSDSDSTPLKLVVKTPTKNSEESTPSLPAGLNFLLKTRAPGKRKVKPVSADKAALLAEIVGSDDDDNDFQVGDISKGSGNMTGSSNTDESDSDFTLEDSVKPKRKKMDKDVKITKVERQKVMVDLVNDGESTVSSKVESSVPGGPKVETLVCLVCLKSTNQNPDNELVQCDGCGVACHILCYGIGECSDEGDDGRSSPCSTASTEPWFCDACRAGTVKPKCELCPNEGGAFKTTDSGHWVHLVCALYTGCTFGEVAGLSKVNVNSIKQKYWGSRICTLCQDPQFASTGVCISCDAGMCRVVFHATCAQNHGLLADAPVAVAHSVLSSSTNSPLKTLPKPHRSDYSSDEEARRRRQQADLKAQEAADPFYACCKRHSNPELTKRHKRNFLAAVRICGTFQQESRWELALGQDRYNRKLDQSRQKFSRMTKRQVAAFMATAAVNLCYQSRPLTSCPIFLKKALLKAKLGGVEEDHFMMSPSTGGSAAPTVVHYAPLGFTPRFLHYFEARNRRIEELTAQCAAIENQELQTAEEENELKRTYEALFQSARRFREQGDQNLDDIHKIQSGVVKFLNKHFKSEDEPKFELPNRPKTMASSDSQKRFENDIKETTGIEISECHVCKHTDEQHMMMHCETCDRHFHCYCLSPPLPQPWQTKQPQQGNRRTSAKWTWECYLCCPSSSDSDIIKKDINPDAPRQLRRGIKAPSRFIAEDGKSKQTEAQADTNKDSNNRNNLYTHKEPRNVKKRSRGSNGQVVENSPAKISKQSTKSPMKQSLSGVKSEQIVPPLKLFIPSISATLLKSPPKKSDPAVYDFSSNESTT